MDDLKQKEGLFYLGEDDKPLALIKFSRKEGPVIVIEHTRVSETLKGRG
ncbi:MAG: N-acetyltransferase, partial [Treponema sp.]|nr:N-acetyltransferase [Treponema sp.]